MKYLLALIGILAVALSACAPRAMQPTSAPAATQAPAMPFNGPRLQSGSGGAAPDVAMPEAGNGLVLGATQPAAAPAESPAGDSGRLVIQNAQLTIVVKDVNARVDAIESMAKNMGGFLVSVNISQTYASDGETPIPQASMTVRVPQDKIDTALEQIKQGAVDVQNETRSGTDVTDQYVDLQSRLRAKQAAEEQLMTIMQGATKTQDVLDVYAQLQQVESDIEVLKGQIKYYEQSAALSAISVSVIAEQTVKPLKVAGWVPAGVARDALQSLIFFWQDFVDFMIRFFLYVVPVLLTIGIPLYLLFLLVRWGFRRMRKPKAVVPVEAQK